MISWTAIVNPSSGARDPRALERCLSGLRSWTSRIALTERPRHATDLARAARDHDGIVVVGGDGTLFEVLQGFDRVRQTLCLVPRGRGNSLARDLGPTAMRTLESAPDARDVQRIDLLKVACRDVDGRTSNLLSASTVAIGYATDVARLASSRLRSFGALSYAISSASVGPHQRDVRITPGREIAVDRRLTGIIASNTRHAASFSVFPRASCSDGTFEALELTRGRVGQWLHNASALARVPFFVPRARNGLESLQVDLVEPHDLLVDGEILPRIVSIDVRILPGALAMACARRSR